MDDMDYDARSVVSDVPSLNSIGGTTISNLESSYHLGSSYTVDLQFKKSDSDASHMNKMSFLQYQFLQVCVSFCSQQKVGFFPRTLIVAEKLGRLL